MRFLSQMKVLEIKGESPGPQKSQRDPPAPPTQVCLLGQDPVLWAVLSIYFIKTYPFCLPPKV